MHIFCGSFFSVNDCSYFFTKVSDFILLNILIFLIYFFSFKKDIIGKINQNNKKNSFFILQVPIIFVLLVWFFNFPTLRYAGYSIVFLFLTNYIHAEEDEINLKAISDQIQVITNDLKTLEKAVYQKSDIVNLKSSGSLSSDGLNEDIMTKHLLKLNEIEDQFRELTNKFEEVNFKLDKLSTRVTKIQSDTQLRFSDLESGSINTTEKNKKVLPGSTKAQDFGAAPAYQTSNLPKNQSINS